MGNLDWGEVGGFGRVAGKEGERREERPFTVIVEICSFYLARM